jgi:predicted negative regulator of RcsB-dependent stress response
MRIIIKLIVPIILLSSCAYFNTYYNAELYFQEAQKLSKENKTGEVSREERQLYDKAIQKTRKLMERYPASSYADDAHLLMSKSYYYRDDFGIALKQLDAFRRDRSDSELMDEVPLWVARCLVATQDLEMAKHESRKLTTSKTNNRLKADAYLLLGEIALEQDSIDLALRYLDHVVKVAPNKDIMAKAALQRGDLYVSEKEFNKALDSYSDVIDKRTSKSLKVAAVLKKFDVMLALGMDNKVLDEIAKMLKEEDYFDIRGRLELELAKVYLFQNDYGQAETKLEEITDNYINQSYSAEAAYELGLLYMKEFRGYPKAKSHFGDIVRLYSRSDFKKAANEHTKNIETLEKYAFDYTNLELKLAGKPPQKKETKTNKTNNARGRSRGRAPGNAIPEASEEVELDVIKDVTSADSIQIQKEMWANLYQQAEHLLFNIDDPKGALFKLAEFELSNRDTALIQNGLYMKYFIYDEKLNNPDMTQAIIREIRGRFPQYYDLVFGEKKEEIPALETQEDSLMTQAGEYYDAHNWDESIRILKSVYADTSAATDKRALSAFKIAWLNDMHARNQDEALEYYNNVVYLAKEGEILKITNGRLKLIKKNDLAIKEPDELIMEEKPEIETEEKIIETK